LLSGGAAELTDCFFYATIFTIYRSVPVIRSKLQRRKIMKKISALVLCLCMALSLCPMPVLAWDGSPASGFAGGSGTKDDPYLIATAGQLALFRDIVNDEDKINICGKLIDNIDLENVDWEPIGISANGYNGTFDGSGYAVKNMLISKFAHSSTAFGGGLFGIVSTNGRVKHLNVAGKVAVTDEKLNVMPDVGGICGHNTGDVEECFATLTVDCPKLTTNYTSSGSGGSINFGGIAGMNSGRIKNCYTVGSFNVNVEYLNIKRPVYVGGITGKIKAPNAKVQNCYSVVTISAASNYKEYTGGLIGDLEYKGTYSNLYTNKSTFEKLIGTGKSSYLDSGTCSALDDSYMKTPEFVADLGSAFLMDTNNVNGGYPVLAVMSYDEKPETSPWVDKEKEENKDLFEKLTPNELKNRDLTKKITRAEFCAVAVNLYEQMGGTVYSASGLSCPFTDVSSDAVTKAYKIGITNGTSETTFSPYSYISRQDVATMLTRVYKALALEGWSLKDDGNYFLDASGVSLFADDAKIALYARNSVYFMAKNEILKGMGDNMFVPCNTNSHEEAIGYANATREQSIIIAVRMFKKLPV